MDKKTHKLYPVFCWLTETAAADLARIDAESNRPPWSQVLFENEFRSTCSRVFGLRLDGTLVGFMVCHVVTYDAHILSFAIAEQYRGKGLGRILLQDGLTELDRLGVKWATLEVRESNSRARQLYESVGFQEVGTRPKYYPDDLENGVVMTVSIRDFMDRKVK